MAKKFQLETRFKPTGDQPEAEGVAIAWDLMARLEIGKQDLIEVAYIDLLLGSSHSDEDSR